MKKIILYTDTPQIGGAELQIFLLAKFLDKTKFKPILVCSADEALNKWCAKFQKEEISVIRIPARSKHDPKHYFELKKIIKSEKADLLHLHIWNPASGRYGLALAKSIPTITTEHDPFKLSPVKRTIKKSLIRGVRKIVTVSENNAEVIRKLYPKLSKNTQVIHNGIDTTWWQSQVLRFTEKDRQEIKEQLFQAAENTLILISIAELHERKGLKYLIKSLPPIIDKYPNTKLVIVGEGGQRTELEKMIKRLKLAKNAILVGRQKDIPKLLKSSDIFVLPSRREAFGLVNVEAMITPLPVIATRAGGIPEVIADGKTGIIVPPENPEALTKAITKLIENSDKRVTFAKAGHQRVLDHFSASVMAEKYQKIYQEVLSA